MDPHGLSGKKRTPLTTNINITSLIYDRWRERFPNIQKINFHVKVKMPISGQPD
jgi:hypothetical protein